MFRVFGGWAQSWGVFGFGDLGGCLRGTGVEAVWSVAGFVFLLNGCSSEG